MDQMSVLYSIFYGYTMKSAEEDCRRTAQLINGTIMCII